MREIAAYLTFDGDCREAMTFYQQCLGGDLHVTTFEQGGFGATPGAEGRLLHARLTRGRTILMASDTMPGMPYRRGNDVALNLFCDDDAEVDRLYALLADGGSDPMPPHEALWGARFALLTDRFGVRWMLNHERQAPG